MTTKHAQKNLAVMFTDISGFTRHTETISREALMARIEQHNALLMPIVAHYDGHVVKSIGDALLITFESPTNAVQCGMLMQHRLRGFNAGKPAADQLHIKVSVNSGEVTVTEDDVFGDPVNVAAKIEKATSPDEVYFTEAVFLAMNKAEVPNAFVKTFRPRGIDSQEIKLYRVLQDEDDPVYRHVVDGAHIDEEAVKTRAAALSSVAGKEVGRTRDAVAHLLAEQQKATRTLLIALGLGVVVLGGAVLGGIAIFGGRGGPSEEQRAVDAARAYLAAGKREDALHVATDFVAKHGSSAAIEALQGEIRIAARNEALAKARELFASGKDTEAAVAIRSAYKDEVAPDGEAAALLARADAWGRARRELGAGRTVEARKAAQEAAGGLPPPEALATLLAQVDALETARKAVVGVPTLDAARAAIQALVTAYGARTADPAAAAALSDAVSAEVCAIAAEEGRAKAVERLKARTDEFPGVTSIDHLRKCLDLSSLSAYAKVPELRRIWASGHYDHEETAKLLADLKEHGKTDADYLFWVGKAMHDVSKANDLAIADGMWMVEEAEKLDPGVLDRHASDLFDLAMDWITWSEGAGSLARRVLRDRFYEKAKDRLVAGLTADRDSGDTKVPNLDLRANCFAILAEKGDAKVVTDRVAFLNVMLEKFVIPGGDGRPSLSAAHAKALFAAAPLEAAEVTRLRGMIEGEIDAAGAKEGPFGAIADAPRNLRVLLDTLLEVAGTK